MLGVVPTGPADKAGLKTGDVVLRVDDRPFDSMTIGYIDAKPPGTELKIDYQRGKTTQTAVVVTEDRISFDERVASEASTPPSSVIGIMSAADAQKAILAALADERGQNLREVHLASVGFSFTRVWGEKLDQRTKVVVPFGFHALLEPPKHAWHMGWMVMLDTTNYLAWDDHDEAERFVTAVNRLIWEDSPQLIAQKELQRQAKERALERQVAAWRAAGSKVNPSEDALRHFVMAREAYKEKDIQHQAEELAAALEIYPTWPDRQSDLAVTLGELGRYSEAIEHMQMYLELAPDAPDAQRAKQQIWIWQDKEKTGRN